MKKILPIFLLFISQSVLAQDPYLNNNIINTSDLFGTSRFVGMGGAMGALGADISTIGTNPAGIGLVTKNEASITAGVSWPSSSISSSRYYNVKGISDGTYASFDQIGTIISFTGSGRLRTVNLAFNYQKKADFNNSFFGETRTAASWADQLNGLAQEAYDNAHNLYGHSDTYYNTLYGLADICGLFRNNIKKRPTDPNSTLSTSNGSLNTADFNVSANLDNRFFFGITLGMDNLEYYRFTDYWEQRTDADENIQDFGYCNEQRITGNGFNLKFGAIVRPFESSTFRFGLAVETPTWYDLEYMDDQSLSTKYAWDDKKGELIYDPSNQYHTYYVYDQTNSNINYLAYNITSPWKVRAQMGSTISTKFAWGLEYEFANYPGTTMSYLSQYGGTTSDPYFNATTDKMLKAQHTLRAGMEFKPISALALRAGYNYITSTTSPDSYWDPYLSDQTLSYPTGLDYMNLSDVHLATLGVGFRCKSFYADLAYKYRHQTGQYYAFDSFYSNVEMAPIPVDFSRHSITATVGIRF